MMYSTIVINPHDQIFWKHRQLFQKVSVIPPTKETIIFLTLSRKLRDVRR